jgi:hypothetical protein
VRREDLVGLRRLGIAEGAGRAGRDGVLRTKADGLRISLVKSFDPLDRLAKAEGSTFSKSSVSISSAFRLPAVGGVIADDEKVSDDDQTGDHLHLPFCLFLILVRD